VYGGRTRSPFLEHHEEYLKIVVRVGRTKVVYAGTSVLGLLSREGSLEGRKRRLDPSGWGKGARRERGKGACAPKFRRCGGTEGDNRYYGRQETRLARGKSILKYSGNGSVLGKKISLCFKKKRKVLNWGENSKREKSLSGGSESGRGERYLKCFNLFTTGLRMGRWYEKGLETIGPEGTEIGRERPEKPNIVAVGHGCEGRDDRFRVRHLFRCQEISGVRPGEIRFLKGKRGRDAADGRSFWGNEERVELRREERR